MDTLAAAGRERVAMGRAAHDKWWGTLGDINVKWLSAPGRSTILLHGSHGDPSNGLDFIQAVDWARLPHLGPVYLLKFNGVDEGFPQLAAKRRRQRGMSCRSSLFCSPTL